jgi:hypothetical protein
MSTSTQTQKSTRERWVVRLVVTRDPSTDDPPTEWNWDIPDADVVVSSGDLVGFVAPDDELCSECGGWGHEPRAWSHRNHELARRIAPCRACDGNGIVTKVL